VTDQNRAAERDRSECPECRQLAVQVDPYSDARTIYFAVAREFVKDEWSEPVQFRFVQDEWGRWDLVMRALAGQENP
jgi:hypothetical protein